MSNSPTATKSGMGHRWKRGEFAKSCDRSPARQHWTFARPGILDLRPEICLKTSRDFLDPSKTSRATLPTVLPNPPVGPDGETPCEPDIFDATYEADGRR
jgi:hypothetical protein